jgi:catechol 2,3-dioxygenase-like lactoylglutathione lyase family enzyme
MASPAAPPPTAGIHHLKFACVDLPASLAWYTRVLGFARDAARDHTTADGRLFSAIGRVPGWPAPLELRQHAPHAHASAGQDPLTLAVATRADLDAWAAWLDAHGVRRSRVLEGFAGWVLVAADPDGRRLRWYTLETHAWTAAPDEDEEWLGVPAVWPGQRRCPPDDRAIGAET